ncbi:MAG: acylneuraminate cytidylyltransferase family protein [Planctomycetes bacterium]|nr:acylneuraminate cytidylyltransferase family protein [Planctomycetota bacterium]
MPLTVLGVITARGGSRGVPRKNLRPLAGRPLIAWTIAAATNSRLLTRTIVSTDDAEIARVARECGGEVPFLRPAELASDTAKTLPTLVHALESVEATAPRRYDYVLTLQPTSPFRTAEDIDAIIRLVEAGRPPSAASVSSAAGSHPLKAKRIVDGNLVDYFAEHPEPEGVPRQALPEAYLRNGALYITRRDVLLAGSLYGGTTRAYLMPAERSLDINSELDLEFAEFVAARRPPPGGPARP